MLDFALPVGLSCARFCASSWTILCSILCFQLDFLVPGFVLPVGLSCARFCGSSWTFLCSILCFQLDFLVLDFVLPVVVYYILVLVLKKKCSPDGLSCARFCASNWTFLCSILCFQLGFLDFVLPVGLSCARFCASSWAFLCSILCFQLDFLCSILCFQLDFLVLDFVLPVGHSCARFCASSWTFLCSILCSPDGLSGAKICLPRFAQRKGIKIGVFFRC